MTRAYDITGINGADSFFCYVTKDTEGDSLTPYKEEIHLESNYLSAIKGQLEHINLNCKKCLTVDLEFVVKDYYGDNIAKWSAKKVRVNSSKAFIEKLVKRN